MRFITLFLVLFLGSISVKAVTVDDCMSLYTKQQYDRSSSCFYKLHMSDTSNAAYKLYYGNSLFAQKRYNDAKVQYSEILQKYSNPKVRASAQKNLAKTNHMLKSITTSRTNDSGTYLSDIQVARWKTMPITVWIENGPYKAIAKRAFSQWQVKSGSAVRFSFTENPRANIVVRFSGDITAVAMTGDALGITKTSVVSGKYITRSEMDIKTTTNTGNVQTPQQLYPVILHEIGHALGIRGHSNNRYDAMYRSDQTYRPTLSNRDINTIKAIYR